MWNFIYEDILKLSKNFAVRKPVAIDRSSFPIVIKNSKKLISFSCNDYLGLSVDKRITNACIDGLKYGSGSSGSKYVSGYSKLCKTLEKKLSKLHKTEDCVLFSSGYLCNLGVVKALCGKDSTLVICDKFVHASIINAVLSCKNTTMIRYNHQNLSQLEQIILSKQTHFNKIIVITETVFSMSGTVTDMEKLIEISSKYGLMLITDDAHGLGVIKQNYKQYSLHIKIGTMSKSIGLLGGYACCSEPIAKYIQNFSAEQIYSTSLPPSVICGAIKAVSIISTLKRHKALENARYFAKFVNIDQTSIQSAIIPFELASNKLCLQASKTLENNGFFIKAIRPPTVPKPCLRIVFSAKHTKKQIKSLAIQILRLTNS